MTDKSEYETLQRTFRIEAPAQYNFGFDVVDRHGEDSSRRATQKALLTGDFWYIITA